MRSLRDELQYFFSGKGMPYEKVAFMVAIVIAVFFSFALSNNVIKDVKVAVIDLDHSKYSREIIGLIDASPFIKVTDILDVPADPKSLFYGDRNVAVLYLPSDLEKNRYNGSAGSIGVFYDNTNSAQTGELKAALNQIVAMENQKNAPDGAAGGEIALHDRSLFNPVGSNSNGETIGFLFFFSSMFFVFATIGMGPRLRMENKLAQELLSGNPLCLLARLLPYACCFIAAVFVGMAILRVLGDLTFTGNIIVFLLSLMLYVPALGMMSLLFGWNSANPGVASSRMILFIPGGFIFGGMTGPIPILPEWMQLLSHFFPLTWEYQFVRDIMMRGASFMDCAKSFGCLMLYVGVIALVFCWHFYRARTALQKDEKQKALLTAEGGV